MNVSAVSTLEVTPGPRLDSTPIVFGTDAFTGGEPNGWTVQGIGRVAGLVRESLGIEPNTSVDTEMQMFVVCPKAAYADLTTEAFSTAWNEFGNMHRLNLYVTAGTTYDTVQRAHPLNRREHDLATTEDIVTRNTGVCSGGYVSVFFMTQELFGLNIMDYWRELLDRRLALKYPDNRQPEIFNRFLREAEDLLAEPGNVWADPDMTAVEYLAIVRHQPSDNSVVSRNFRVMHPTERRLWLRTGQLSS